MVCSAFIFSFFEVCHPRCVSNKSNYKVYANIVKNNYRLGGMLFTICKTQLHVSATNIPYSLIHIQRQAVDEE